MPAGTHLKLLSLLVSLIPGYAVRTMHLLGKSWNRLLLSLSQPQVLVKADKFSPRALAAHELVAVVCKWVLLNLLPG